MLFFIAAAVDLLLAFGCVCMTLRCFLTAGQLGSNAIAGIAMGTLYGEGGFTQEQSKSRPGTMGALLDVHDDQQFRFAVAVLTTEWRRDIADKMAMRFVDRNVKKGKKYEYIVRPTEFDSTHHITFRVGQIEVENKAYSPQKFDLTMGDSLVGINTVRFWWENKKEFSTFEVERRQLGDENWVRINQNPYIMMRGLNEPDADNYIRDVVPGPGLYEYRVLGYDAFGDLTEPSHAHIVTVADINAPKPADLKHVIIDRRNKKELYKDVFATFSISCFAISIRCSITASASLPLPLRRSVSASMEGGSRNTSSASG